MDKLEFYYDSLFRNIIETWHIIWAFKTPMYIALGLLGLITLLCVIIIVNQRKLKKQLQQLLDTKEDKPE